MTKSMRNTLVRAIQAKLDTKKTLTRDDREIINAIIHGELKKWVALDSYWNIKIGYLVFLFKERHADMSIERKMELIEEFALHAKDPYKFRHLKELLQDEFTEMVVMEKNSGDDVILERQEKDEIVLSPIARVLTYRVYTEDTETEETHFEEYYLDFTMMDLFAGMVQ